MEDENVARHRKSNRVSVFVAKGDEDDAEKSSTKQPDPVTSPKKQRASSFAGKGFSQPAMKKRKHTVIQFIPRDSDTLETRIYEPSWISKSWRFLTEGLVEPKRPSTAEESYVYHLRGLTMHGLHAILVFCVIYGTFDLEYNYHTIIMADLITKSDFESSFVLHRIRFHDIRAPQHIWDFIRGLMLKILYPVETNNDTHSILQDNVMVGVAQLRQVRVKNDSCQTDPFFGDLYKACYGYFLTAGDEDTEPFGLNSSAPWRYSINLNKRASGQFALFTGSGYTLNFSRDYNWTVDQLNELENNQWIRQSTRAVFLDFFTFCPNTNSFLAVEINFEIMPWGAVYPTLHIYSVKLLTSLNDAKAFALLGLDIVLFGYTVGLNYLLFLRLKRRGMKTLFTYNNLIDVAIISSTYTTLGVHIALTYHTTQKLESIVEMIPKSESPSFGIFISTYELYFTTAAVLLLCIVLKLIRYALLFNETAKLFICALRKVKGELICFTITNVSILIGWSFIYCTVYGTVYRHMNTPIKCFVALILNHARGDKLYVDDSTVGALPPPNDWLLYLTVPIAVIYINCISNQTYVALMVHGWQLAVRDCANQALRIKAFEMNLILFVQILEKLKLFKFANKLQEYYIVQMNEDDYYPITQIMRRHGWSRLEIRLLLRKYGIRKGDDLTTDEVFEVYQDFWMRNTLFLEVTSHEQLKTDLEYIRRLLKYTESAIADLKISIERLADQFLDKQANRRPILREPSSPTDTLADSSRKSFLGRFWK